MLKIYDNVVSQAGIAIALCLWENTKRRYGEQIILVCTDICIAVFKAHAIKSNLVWNYLECLLNLDTRNKITTL